MYRVYMQKLSKVCVKLEEGLFQDGGIVGSFKIYICLLLFLIHLFLLLLFFLLLFLLPPCFQNYL